MATTNHERAGKALDLLRQRLASHIERERKRPGRLQAAR